MKKILKTVDPQKDHVLSTLCYNAHTAVSILCDYMQDRTPYGDEYMRAYNQYKKVIKELQKLDDALSDTADLRWKLKNGSTEKEL